MPGFDFLDIKIKRTIGLCYDREVDELVGGINSKRSRLFANGFGGHRGIKMDVRNDLQTAVLIKLILMAFHNWKAAGHLVGVEGRCLWNRDFDLLDDCVEAGLILVIKGYLDFMAIFIRELNFSGSVNSELTRDSNDFHQQFRGIDQFALFHPKLEVRMGILVYLDRPRVLEVQVRVDIVAEGQQLIIGAFLYVRLSAVNADDEIAGV